MDQRESSESAATLMGSSSPFERSREPRLLYGSQLWFIQTHRIMISCGGSDSIRSRQPDFGGRDLTAERNRRFSDTRVLPIDIC